MGLSLAGPSGVSLALRVLPSFACVDPVTDASGFPYGPSFDGGLDRVCQKYCSAQDSAWKKHWGLHQGLMLIHCPRVDIPRAVAKIRKDRSRAVVVVPMGSTEEESTRDWLASLENMTLNKVVLPTGASFYQNATE